jgi:hypothetical protein
MGKKRKADREMQATPQPIEHAQAPTPATTRDAKIGRLQLNSELGSTGLNHTAGYIRDDFLLAWNGSQGMKTRQEMACNDPAVGAMLFTIDKLIRQVEPQTEVADHPRGEEAAALFNSCRDGMEHTWSDFMSEVLSMLPYGFAPFEPVYMKREDGRIGWKKLPLRAQTTVDRWELAENGDVLGMYQMAPPSYRNVYIPADRLVLFRTSSAKNNPEGVSILRNAYRPWYFKKRIEEYEAIGIERHMAGFPVFYHPAEWSSDSATDAEQAAYQDLQEAMRRIRIDEQAGLALPAIYDDKGNLLMKFELISSSGSIANANTGAVIARKNMEILMTCLADFVLLGHEKSGSWALADSKTSIFAAAIGAWLQIIAATINRVLIARLMTYNAIPAEAWPKIRFGDIETPDLQNIADYVAKLTSATAILPDGALEAHLRRIAGLPQAETAE